ncbi:MAG: dTMP kinase [candidate division Zixibacteria bacterium]|nr:dTMP kinase [candidate division Zixibacteria bacterium]MCI0596346.1 dTMP kinase [candidate division Zixibacteria bacterium]
MAEKKTPPYGGVFVTFEGIDGSGKTTQAKLLFQTLKKEGWPVVLFREPGGTKVAEKLRRILLQEKSEPIAARAEILLYVASRAQLVEQKIKPALKAKKLVICDRYVDSTTAYQAYGRGFDPVWVEKLNRWGSSGILPELTFLIDVPVRVGLARKKGKLLDRLEREGKSFEKKVYQGYHRLAKKHRRIRIMDGTPSPVEVAKKVKKVMGDYLKRVEK